ncbi:GNAT family N-acetyltransferase [Streptomyces sp. BR123]|uniref:GNAT family N-acetyltransferase n=1 Tax=Streptomyces sp. BR123 TaxID=2749828 RepID=UPI0015C4C849|nr:GNAT family N-acetyltransferase [Streptomyces sp. BR123]NXY97979.1 GNAT family N-acetyltransferase [Streptomyces sp. BR123]
MATTTGPVGPLDLGHDATAAAVHRIGRAAYAVEARLIGFDGIPALRESLAELRERPLRWLGAAGAGAEGSAEGSDGPLAGFLAWEREPDGSVCVDRLCVDPAWFRRGVASLLLRALLAEVPADRPVRVSTGAANAPAVALYERFGFVRGADFSPAPGLLMASFTLAPRTGPAAGGPVTGQARRRPSGRGGVGGGPAAPRGGAGN